MQKQALLISLLSLFSAFYFNEINFHTLQKEFPAEYANRYTVFTPDDASYLVPPANFLSGNGWHSNDSGSGAYLFRTPGYGCFFLCCKIIGGAHALWVLRTLQLLLFAFSVYLFCLAAFNLTNNKLLSFIISCIYGILPFTHGFIYYTLTEGITPFLVILCLFYIIRSAQTVNIKHLYWAAITLAVLLIVRPQLLVLYFAFFPFYYRLLKININKALTVSLFTTVISFSLLAAWQVRNYAVAGSWVSLNAVYHPDNNSIFRPQHQAIGEFYKSFGADVDLFHQSVHLLWQHALMGDTSEIYINEILAKIPQNIINCTGKKELLSAFKLYQACSLEQRFYIAQKIPMPNERRTNEDVCVAAFKGLTDKVNSYYFFDTHVMVPVKTYFKLALHSNLSLHVFQHEWRGKWWMELLRWICAIIHASLFVLFLLQVFLKKDLLTSLLLIVPLVYLFYLCYFQVLIEERYTLPLLPILMLGAARVIQAISNRNKMSQIL